MTSDFRVLMTAAPRVKYDLTMHYRYADFGEVVGYIRTIPGVQVSVLDGAVLNHLIRDYVSEFLKDYDLVIFYTETAEAKITKELAELCKQVSPATKIAVYGDATLYIPKYFAREPFDAVHINGDQDLVLGDYVRFLQSGEPDLHGLLIQDTSTWKATQLGKLLHANEWSFPAIDMLPIDEYKLFCAIKGVKTFDGSVYVAKGCRYGCAYCVLPRREGLPDRRRPIEPLLDYLVAYQNTFDVYQLHAGTFTEDRSWVKSFCERLKQRQLNIPWKCTTRVDCLDEEMIEVMAQGGCRGINIGVESLSRDGFRLTNKTTLDDLEQLAIWLEKYNVHSKAYIMVGMPHQSKDDVIFTIQSLESIGFSTRPTGYTPFHKLAQMSVEQLDQLDLEKWDRKSLFPEDIGMSAREFHEILLLATVARDSQAEIMLTKPKRPDTTLTIEDEAF